MNSYWKRQVWMFYPVGKHSEKPFGGGGCPPTPLIRPRVNRAKESTTLMNSHRKHTGIHWKSIFFTYFIDEKVKYDDIYCLQKSVFYFSYNVSTVACNAKHDFHNGGPLGRSGNESHQSEASKATVTKTIQNKSKRRDAKPSYYVFIYSWYLA